MTSISEIQPNIGESQPLQYDKIPVTCPCCDNVVYAKTNSISFDYWKGLVFKDDRQVRLEPMEADLLKILLDNWPETLSKEKILLGLYGGNYSDKIFSDRIGVLMAKLRRKIEPLGIEIENIKRRGWWLIRTPSQAHRLTKLN